MLDHAEQEKQELRQQLQASQASFEASMAQSSELRARLANTESTSNNLREQVSNGTVLTDCLLSDLTLVSD